MSSLIDQIDDLIIALTTLKVFPPALPVPPVNESILTPVNDLTALKSKPTTGISNGTIINVVTLFSTYEFISGTGGTADNFNIVTADDAGGQWWRTDLAPGSPALISGNTVLNTLPETIILNPVDVNLIVTFPPMLYSKGARPGKITRVVNQGNYAVQLKYSDGSNIYSGVNSLTTLELTVNSIGTPGSFQLTQVFGGMAAQMKDSVLITGGNIDDTVIGNTTPSIGNFSELNMTGSLMLDADATQNLEPVSYQQFLAIISALQSGFKYKGDSYAATTANLSATYSNGASGVGATLTFSDSSWIVDGIAATSIPNGEQITVKNQTNQIQNGFYTKTSNTVLTRSTNADNSTPGELVAGCWTKTLNGTQASLFFQLITAGTIVIGTTDLVIVQLDMISAIGPLQMTGPVTIGMQDSGVTSGSVGTVAKTLTATVNQWGLLTALAAVDIAISQLQVTGLVAALAAKQPLSGNLTELAALDPASGLVAQTLTGIFVPRICTSPNSLLTIGNGDGKLGNISFTVNIANFNIPSTQISDATVAGRALLTGADTIAQRLSLGLGSAALQPSNAFADSSTTISAGGRLSGGGSLAAARTITLNTYDFYLNPITHSTVSRTIGVNDVNDVIQWTYSAADGLVTLPSNTTAAVPIGGRVKIINASGTKNITASAGSGATLIGFVDSANNAVIGPNGWVTFEKTNTNEWTVIDIYENYTHTTTLTWGSYTSGNINITIIRSGNLIAVNFPETALSTTSQTNLVQTNTVLPARFRAADRKGYGGTVSFNSFTSRVASAFLTDTSGTIYVVGLGGANNFFPANTAIAIEGHVLTYKVA